MEAWEKGLSLPASTNKETNEVPFGVLGSDSLARAMGEGRSMSLTEAVDLVRWLADPAAIA